MMLCSALILITLPVDLGSLFCSIPHRYVLIPLASTRMLGLELSNRKVYEHLEPEAHVFAMTSSAAQRELKEWKQSQAQARVGGAGMGVGGRQGGMQGAMQQSQSQIQTQTSGFRPFSSSSASSTRGNKQGNPPSAARRAEGMPQVMVTYQ